MPEITAPFEITEWDETPVAEAEAGPAMASAHVHKRFTGPLEATSVAAVLTAQGDDGAGYVAQERVTGALEGRPGTFVVQHGAVGSSAGGEQFGTVVPGSGTGELTGLTGQARYLRDDHGHRLTLTYER